ncbi:putative membrane protein [Laceyella sediminis]|uniref:Membrane protein n=1 Tax=Laceyella sediminis TaxID=573074 RepID=A0ABX5EUD4_9BACL|nr:DUF2157 domain-containing protein [Laceyella sediminis]PRZ15930.1 putative membrane protein [Laceyella sediminis]
MEKNDVNQKGHRMISPSRFAWLKQELLWHEREGRIQAEQVRAILSDYEVRGGLNFIRVLLVIGALLVGVGVLSFIAGNWSELPRIVKFLLILCGLVGAYVAGWRLERPYPKTAKSLYYIGLAIFGAGIFLIGQMFHFSSHYSQAFLAWAIGAIPLIFYLKDKWVALFAITLMGVYTSAAWDEGVDYPFLTLAMVPLSYWLNERVLGKSKLVLFFANGLAIYLIWATMGYFNLSGGVMSAVLLVLGVTMALLPSQRYAAVLKWQGGMVHGLAAVFLTFPEYWQVWERTFGFAGLGVLVAAAYLALILYSIKKGSLPAVIITCVLIFRFYLDLSYDFLPKSLYFLLAGGLLIGCGFWIERSRKKKGERA